MMMMMMKKGVELPNRSVLEHVDVTPEVKTGRSRIARYRKEYRRRRRKRRVKVAAATGVAVVAMALVCYTCPELVQSTHRNYIQPTMDMVHDNVVQPVQKVANDLQGRFSSSRSRGGTSQTSTDHKTKKARKVKQPSTSTSPVSIASDADSVMVEEMAFLQRQAAEEEERQQEARRQAAAQAEAAAAAATEAARLEALRRPAGCNIPLAYLVNKRCNRLATDNPLYSAADLVQSMMQ